MFLTPDDSSAGAASTKPQASLVFERGRCRVPSTPSRIRFHDASGPDRRSSRRSSTAQTACRSTILPRTSTRHRACTRMSPRADSRRCSLFPGAPSSSRRSPGRAERTVTGPHSTFHRASCLGAGFVSCCRLVDRDWRRTVRDWRFGILRRSCKRVMRRGIAGPGRPVGRFPPAARSIPSSST